MNVKRATGVAVAVAAGTILVVAAVAIGGGKPISTSSESGMTAEERDALHEAQFAAWQQKYEAWIADLDVSTLNLAKLPRKEQMVELKAPPATFAQSVTAADSVVRGKVTGIRPTTEGTWVTMRVEKVLKAKGKPGTVTFLQGSTFEPNTDWTGAVILDSPGGPLLLPGDRALVFLTTHPDGTLSLREPAGMYLIDAKGTAHAAGYNPYAVDT